MTRKELKRYLEKNLIPAFVTARDNDPSDGNTPQWRLIERLIDGLALTLGDKRDGWLNYYLWDCRCGETPKKVVLSCGKKITLDSVKKLVKLLIP